MTARYTRTLAATLFFVLLLPLAAQAGQPPVVGVVPFSVYADAELDYLGPEIAKKLAEQLRQEGAETISEKLQAMSPLAGRDPRELSPEDLNTLALLSGSEFLVYGSFFMADGNYSLDAKLLPIRKKVPPATFFIEGQGMETLMAKVSELSDEIAAVVLGRRKVTEIKVEGNRGIETDAILKVVETKPGDVFSPKNLSADLELIWAMGYFDDVRIEAVESPEGQEVIIHLKTKPRVNKVDIDGNSHLETTEIKDVLDIHRGSILNIFRIEENIRRIQSLYKEKNYYNAKIEFEVEPIKDDWADLTIKIDEGDKVLVKEISFEGNDHFSDKQLRGIMETKEKGFFSWVTSSGTLEEDTLEQDTARLRGFYHNQGFLRAKVGEPDIKIEGNWIYINFKVEEGYQYKVGEVSVTGDLIMPKKVLLSNLKIREEEYYNLGVLRQDKMLLADRYNDAGFAFADIMPKTNINEEDKVVNIVFDIRQGPVVFYDEIIITGNTKTRDYVIRRELPIYEQGLYSGSGLKMGIRRLTKLDYFEDVKVDTVKSGEEDKVTVKLNVEEKPTGAFTFGGGYSSVDNLFIVTSVSQRNLFGRGQTLSLQARFGSSTTQYNLSFTEPYLFGTRLSAGLDVYNWERDYTTYVRESVGGRVRFGYRLMDFTILYWDYTYDVTNITNILAYAPEDILNTQSESVESSVSISPVYDTRNRNFNPTRGNKSSVLLKYAGGVLGGDIAYTKIVGESGQFFPLLWDFVGFVRAEGGYVKENTSDGYLPLYDRFFMGGINSLRGYYWEDVGPHDQFYNPLGGDKYIQGNAEIHYPIIDGAGLVGLVFYDTGNVWGEGHDVNFGDLLQTWGVGVRWYSPMGPIRLEYGWIIDKPSNIEYNGRFEFAMGAAF